MVNWLGWYIIKTFFQVSKKGQLLIEKIEKFETSLGSFIDSIWGALTADLDGSSVEE